MEIQKIITLRKPVTLGEKTFTELTLSEPTAGQIEKASIAGGKVDMSVAIALIALVSGAPRTAIQMLGQRDFKEASDFLGGFSKELDSGEETSSGMPSPT